MANREENLKKINSELEMLSDEELEQVAGGTYDRHQLADDSRMLNVLLRGTDIQPERNNWFCVSPLELEKVWRKFGVEIKEGSFFGGHSYYLDGKKISQQEAWEHVQNIVGKHLKRSDWDW